MDATERHRTLANAYHALRHTKLELIPVEEALADSIDPHVDHLIQHIGQAQDLLDKAGALIRHLKDQHEDS